VGGGVVGVSQNPTWPPARTRATTNGLLGQEKQGRESTDGEARSETGSVVNPAKTTRRADQGRSDYLPDLMRMVTIPRAPACRHEREPWVARRERRTES